MRLLSTVFGFLLRKLGLFVAVLVSMFLVLVVTSALLPPVKKAWTERDRLEAVVREKESLEEDLGELKTTYEEEQSKAVDSLTEKVEVEVAEADGEVSEQRAEVERKRKAMDEGCGFWAKVGSALAPGNACKAARKAVESAEAALDTFEENRAEAEQELAMLADPDLTAEEKLDHLGVDTGRDTQRGIDNTESDLSQKQAEEESLREARASWAGWLVRLWQQTWKWLVTIAVVVLVMPLLLRTINYFVLMPLVSRVHKPIHLAAGSEIAAAKIKTGPASRTLRIELASGEVLLARSEHVREVRGKKPRSRLLYDWTAPFISFAAGLHGLSRFIGDEDGTDATLATPDDPNSYLMRIDFMDHPGLVMHPKHVVGVIGTPELVARWRWGFAAIATWQVRYIMFVGTGSLIVQGSGDVVAATPGSASAGIKQHLVMGFDSRLLLSVRRTEVFHAYLRGKAPLVDDDFRGDAPYFGQKAAAVESSNPLVRAFNSFFSALGKLLGF